MPFLLTTDQKTNVSFSVSDRYGNPATIDGAPRWESSDPGVAFVAPSEDGLSADIVTAGRLGPCQITVRCDADLGDGIRELPGVLDVDVVGGEAVMIALTPGPATPKDADEPAPVEPGEDDDEQPVPDAPPPAPDEPVVPTP